MESELVLQNLKVIELKLEVNDRVDFDMWKNKEDNQLRFSVNPELSVSQEKPSSGRLRISVELFDEEYLSKDEPFYLKLEMFFYFEDRVLQEDQNIGDKYYVNMISIAYPYLRAHITSISALSGMSPVVLPAINVFEMLKESRKVPD